MLFKHERTCSFVAMPRTADANKRQEKHFVVFSDSTKEQQRDEHMGYVLVKTEELHSGIFVEFCEKKGLEMRIWIERFG